MTGGTRKGNSLHECKEEEHFMSARKRSQAMLKVIEIWMPARQQDEFTNKIVTGRSQG